MAVQSMYIPIHELLFKETDVHYIPLSFGNDYLTFEERNGGATEPHDELLLRRLKIFNKEGKTKLF